MRAIRVHFDDGQTVETNINGTDEEIRRHYIGQPFEFDETKPCHTATRVEFLDETPSATPGPWDAREVWQRDGQGAHYRVFSIERPNYMGHATVFSPSNIDDFATVAADARLIAAAPELLAALKSIIDYAENEAQALWELRDSPEAEREAIAAETACDAARDAIAKATGTTP